MASEVDISNLALSHIGARSQVSSISPPDGTVEAGYCARFYPLARRELLEAYSWPFALKRSVLAPLTNISTVWAYMYARPANCITPLRVLPLQVLESYSLSIDRYTDAYPDALVDTLFTERGTARFELEGDFIFTNEPEAVLLYTMEQTDTSKFTPLFTSAVGMLLASYLAGPILKGLDGARASQTWRNNALTAATAAAARTANSGSTRNDFVPGHLSVRG
jgi:hypothetical protein